MDHVDSILDDALAEMAESLESSRHRLHDRVLLAFRSGQWDYESLLNQLSLAVAERFDSGAIGYSDADDLMNTLWGVMTDEAMERSFPTAAWDVFEAFDEGEYDHGDDRDPVDTFTIPLVKEALRTHSRP